MPTPTITPKMSSVTCGLRYRRAMPRPTTGSESAASPATKQAASAPARSPEPLVVTTMARLAR
jgi:hypothetical protein